MRSGSKGGAGGGGRGKGGKSATGTAAAVAGTIGAATSAASAPAPAAVAAAQAAAPAPAAVRSVSVDTSKMNGEQFHAAESRVTAAHEATFMKALSAADDGGGLINTGRVRQEAAKLGLADKGMFDLTAAKLMRQERVQMHYHDYPSSLTQAQRDAAVWVPNRSTDNSVTNGFKGTFFNGLAKWNG